MGQAAIVSNVYVHHSEGVYEIIILLLLLLLLFVRVDSKR